MTVIEERQAPASSPPPRRPNRAWALLRNSWRQLTSMRTALVLLFLLAIAAIPGSVFPQRSVNAERVTQYYQAHPDLAPWLERLGGFSVYASPWFASIYLLLFTSLIGCVVPRLLDHVRALRQAPPDAPKRLDRLPQSAPQWSRSGAPAEVARSVAEGLRRRRFRTKLRQRDDGSWTVSAEKGYLKETGNLLFHTALLAVLIGVGFGHWYGWHANRILIGGNEMGFCNTLTQYDDSTLGPRVHPADLPVFCLRLSDFDASFQETGQPKSFSATVQVSQDNSPYETRKFTVNDPLRLDEANVYLLGHGYAPVLKYTDRFGVSQTKIVPFLPMDAMQTSEGVAQFPDVNIDPKTDKRDPTLQVGFEGMYLPTAPTDGTARSIFPAENNPMLYLSAYRGDLGLDVGTPGSVYSLNQGQIASGDLKKVSDARPYALKLGGTWTLDDGSKLEFVGTRPFATLSIRHDPTQALALAGAVAGLLGLMLSLAGHRRRVWFTVQENADLAGSPGSSGGTLVTAGGLPRTDYPGFSDEFKALVKAAEEGTP
ncbi:cytochrome c biogenesis protein ResB [Paractinoplanes lichenicola]|uniref:Cytochrome c biogenesis protein ResB n=1 Tax=Paractinoplanes lichenicola TaxID=2802976 RepID=A0ABS1W2B8_9ACTN|nr:cytochrome c biogenesis protein ResB [Actinoplanes lichenicola]MBL7260886.1 cytochrome c biogenesis protein ResB [Actinoplanes lichenicola]